MSELTGRRGFVETFVKEIVVVPGNELSWATPSPCQTIGLIPGRNAEEMALNGLVLSTAQNGGSSSIVL